MSSAILGTMLLLVAVAGRSQAAALPVVDGFTSVKLTSFASLAGLGIGVAGLGTATVSPGSDGTPLAYFPVTGGAIDTGSFAGTIEHLGSGLSLSKGATTLNLEDFTIDTASLQLSGLVNGGGPAQLFDIGLSGNAFLPFELKLSSTAGTALAGAFGIPDLSGTVIGLANSVPVTTAVPEPSTYGMLAAGLAAIAWVGWRRSRSLCGSDFRALQIHRGACRALTNPHRLTGTLAEK
jgi:hypothetical protein